LVGFVNGLPRVVIELEKPGVPARAAFEENLTSRRRVASGSFGTSDGIDPLPTRAGALRSWWQGRIDTP
jgi:type I restriction enzyme R subunit